MTRCLCWCEMDINYEAVSHKALKVNGVYNKKPIQFKLSFKAEYVMLKNQELKLAWDSQSSVVDYDLLL